MTTVNNLEDRPRDHVESSFSALNMTLAADRRTDGRTFDRYIARAVRRQRRHTL